MYYFIVNKSLILTVADPQDIISFYLEKEFNLIVNTRELIKITLIENVLIFEFDNLEFRLEISFEDLMNIRDDNNELVHR